MLSAAMSSLRQTDVDSSQFRSPCQLIHFSILLLMFLVQCDRHICIHIRYNTNIMFPAGVKNIFDSPWCFSI